MIIYLEIRILNYACAILDTFRSHQYSRDNVVETIQEFQEVEGYRRPQQLQTHPARMIIISEKRNIVAVD